MSLIIMSENSNFCWETWKHFFTLGNFYETRFPSFLPSSQETCGGKVTQLYTRFFYEHKLKMAWTLLLPLVVIQRPWHVLLIFITWVLVAEKGTDETLPQSLKKSHAKKTNFGWWDPDMCNPVGCGKGTHNTSVTLPSQYPSGSPKLQNLSKQLTREKSLCYKNVQMGDSILLSQNELLFICLFPGPGLGGGYEKAPLIQNC